MAETKSKTKVVATWKPGVGNPHLRREITVKQAKQIAVDLDSDLVWEATNANRVDVTDVNPALLDILRGEADAEGKKVFSFTEE